MNPVVNTEFRMLKIGFKIHLWNVLNKNKLGELIRLIQDNK